MSRNGHLVFWWLQTIATNIYAAGKKHTLQLLIFSASCMTYQSRSWCAQLALTAASSFWFAMLPSLYGTCCNREVTKSYFLDEHKPGKERTDRKKRRCALQTFLIKLLPECYFFLVYFLIIGFMLWFNRVSVYWLFFKDCCICYLLAHNNEPIAECLKTISIYYFFGSRMQMWRRWMFLAQGLSWDCWRRVWRGHVIWRPGRESRLYFQEAHSRATGSWQKASVSLHTGLSVDAISSKYSGWLPLGDRFRRARQKPHCL